MAGGRASILWRVAHDQEREAKVTRGAGARSHAYSSSPTTNHTKVLMSYTPNPAVRFCAAIAVIASFGVSVSHAGSPVRAAYGVRVLPLEFPFVTGFNDRQQVIGYGPKCDGATGREPPLTFRCVAHGAGYAFRYTVCHSDGK